MILDQEVTTTFDSNKNYDVIFYGAYTAIEQAPKGGSRDPLAIKLVSEAVRDEKYGDIFRDCTSYVDMSCQSKHHNPW